MNDTDQIPLSWYQFSLTSCSFDLRIRDPDQYYSIRTTIGTTDKGDALCQVCINGIVPGSKNTLVKIAA